MVLLMLVAFSGCTEEEAITPDNQNSDNTNNDDTNDNDDNNDNTPQGIDADGDIDKAIILSSSETTFVDFYRYDTNGRRFRSGGGTVGVIVDDEDLLTNPILPPESGEVEYVIISYKVTGAVQNIAGYTLNQVVVTVNFYDIDYNFLGSGSTSTQNLPNDKTWNFEISWSQFTNARNIHFGITAS